LSRAIDLLFIFYPFYLFTLNLFLNFPSRAASQARHSAMAFSLSRGELAG
jgi:hypothetical protein